MDAVLGALKVKIMEATSVPVCRQALSGWMGTGESFGNATVLNTLNVARENVLVLHDLSEDGTMDGDNDIINRLNDTFTLNIVRHPSGVKIPLKCPGKTTILEVKTNVFSITDIPVRHQEWTGWPSNITNQTTLAQCGIELEHNLILASKENTSATTRSSATTSATAARSTNVIDIDSSDSSVDEFEDASDFNADDDLFSDTTVRNRINYLSKKNE